jgi:hypothetical protein
VRKTNRTVKSNVQPVDAALLANMVFLKPDSRPRLLIVEYTNHWRGMQSLVAINARDISWRFGPGDRPTGAFGGLDAIEPADPITGRSSCSIDAMG